MFEDGVIKMRTILLSFLGLAGIVCAQENDRVTVPFSNASKPRFLEVHLLNGSITVKGYSGKEAIIEARGVSRRNRRNPREADGLRRLDMVDSGLNVEEQDNVIKIGAGPNNNNLQLEIQVPTETSVKLRSINDSDLVVEGVSGEIDVNSTNGSVTVTNVTGTVLAHALNGKVVVRLDRVTPGKPMSFSSLNGDIDVTLPPDIKANVKMKTDHGDIYTDFEITMQPSARQPGVQERREGGRYKLSFDRAFYGTINGGGPELQFTTLNGRIFIRQKK
jgi:DUF4097 and DUF4098 domain-containing protein YvlB